MNREQSTSISGNDHPENPMGEGADRACRPHESPFRSTLHCHFGRATSPLSFRGPSVAREPGSITTIWEYGFRARRFAAPRNDSGECSGTQRYLKVIKSVRLRVEAFVFKGSLVAFELF